MRNTSRYAWLGAALALSPVVSSAAEKVKPTAPLVQVNDVPTETLQVTKGQHVVLPIKGVKRIAVGDSKIADVEVLAGESKAAPLVQINDAPAQTLHLTIGHQMSLTAKGLRRISLADPDVANATVIDGKEILLTGIANGETSLILWVGKDTHVNYVIKVSKYSPEDRAAQLKELLKSGG